MKRERIAKMVDRIAQDEESKPLMNVDQAIDNMVAAIVTIDENLSAIDTETPAQKKALVTVRDLVETAVAPYTADIIKAMEAFETG